MYFRICATLIVVSVIVASIFVPMPSFASTSTIDKAGSNTKSLFQFLSYRRKFVRPKLYHLPFLAVESACPSTMKSEMAFDRATRLCDEFGYQKLDSYELAWAAWSGKAYFFHGKELTLLIESSGSSDFPWATFRSISCSEPKLVGPVFTLMIPETDARVEDARERKNAPATTASDGEAKPQDKQAGKKSAE